MTAARITIPVAPGELVDKITILEIKADRLTAPEALSNVTRELELLRAVQAKAIPPSDEIATLSRDLRGVNEALWEIEDDIRDCERAQDFGPRFIELARAVYRTNDRRAALKRQINDALGSDIVEEKSYSEY